MCQFRACAAIRAQIPSYDSLDNNKHPSGGHCRIRMPHEQARVCFQFAMLPLWRFSCCCSKLLITQVYGKTHKHSDRKHQLHNHEPASSYQESRRRCFMPMCFCSSHATPWQSEKSLAHEAASFDWHLGVFIPYDCSLQNLNIFPLTPIVWSAINLKALYSRY